MEATCDLLKLNQLHMKKTLILLVFGLALGMASCKKEKTDPAYCSQAWAEAVLTEWNNVISGGLAYSADPNHTTCVAYKDAYQAYIDALEPFLNCSIYTPQQKAALQDAIDQAEASLVGLCDE